MFKAQKIQIICPFGFVTTALFASPPYGKVKIDQFLFEKRPVIFTTSLIDLEG